MTAAARTGREQISPRRGMRVDNPLTDPKHDRLNRMPAARRLVRQAYEALADSETVAIGLNAPWGWGKTSFLRLMEEAVEEDPDFFDRDPNRPPPVVIWFNPWWFSGREDLYVQFFLEISQQAGTRLSAGTRRKLSSRHWEQSPQPHPPVPPRPSWTRRSTSTRARSKRPVASLV